MVDYRAIIKNRELRLKLIYLLRYIPDRPYLKMVYYIKTGKKLDLKHPVTFCEKQNWLKLNNKHNEYTQLADKLAVRKYIENRLGSQYSFPLLGVWDRAEEIDFNKLPESFVLKCNHDSGSVKIIRNKSALTDADIKEIRQFFSYHLGRSDFYDGREYPYKDIKPCVIAEQLMADPEGNLPKDYKFFCFNGEPRILFVASDRESDVKFDFYDMEWNHRDIVNIHPQSGKAIEKPECFEEMKAVAAKLSQNMPFVRMDLYEIGGKVYFGEFTFFHGGGFWPMTPEHWEKDLGDLIDLTD